MNTPYAVDKLARYFCNYVPVVSLTDMYPIPDGSNDSRRRWWKFRFGAFTKAALHWRWVTLTSLKFAKSIWWSCDRVKRSVISGANVSSDDGLRWIAWRLICSEGKWLSQIAVSEKSSLPAFKCVGELSNWLTCHWGSRLAPEDRRQPVCNDYFKVWKEERSSIYPLGFDWLSDLPDAGWSIVWVMT